MLDSLQSGDFISISIRDIFNFNLNVQFNGNVNSI